MFAKFNLEISEIHELQRISQNILNCNIQDIDPDKIRKDIRPNLKSLVKGFSDNHVLDGDDLKKYVFPTGGIGNYDIFISYSHNDQSAAIFLASWLEQQCKLKVFLDSYVWGCADGLLREIDDLFCKEGNGLYNYSRRNYSTSHVHAMLSMAIMDIINNTECCIFINSGHSINLTSLRKATSAKTLSPWIYEENKMMLLLPSHLERLRNEHFSINEEAARANSIPPIGITHKIDFTGFKELTCKNLKEMRGKGKTGLDELYESFVEIR